MHPAPKLLSLCILATLSAACKRSPDVPKELTYLIIAKDLSYVDARVTAQGKTAIFQKAAWNATQDVARTELKIPRDAPLMLSELRIELVTPCGVKPMPVKVDQTEADEKKARETMPHFYVDVRPEKIPESIDLWIDAKKDQKVKVGAAEVTGRHVRLYEPACGPAPVTVDGKEVGTIKPDLLKNKESAFIAGDSGTCYAHEFVAYGGTGSSSRQILRGKNVYELASGKIEYFLTKAPSSKSLSKGASETYARELVAIPCP